jgi:hypothetical protein
MKALGVTVYPVYGFDLEKNKKYLELANELGITRVFASTFCITPSDITKSDYLSDLKSLATHASKLQMSFQLDLFPEIFEAFGASYDNIEPLVECGINELRIDEGYTYAEMAVMSRNPKCKKIVINASEGVILTVENSWRVIDVGDYLEENLNQYINAGGIIEKLEASHNLYPHIDTGLSMCNLQRKHKAFQKYGIEVSAFVAAQSYEYTLFNMMNGSPTVEDQRELMAHEACRELFAAHVAESVFIGDGFASRNELSLFGQVLNETMIHLRVKVTGNLSESAKEVIFEKIHFNRGFSVNVIRSTKCRSLVSVEPDNTIERRKYSVTIDNNRVERYFGEVQISYIDLKSDPRINVVGLINKNDQRLVSWIGIGDEFRFIEEN